MKRHWMGYLACAAAVAMIASAAVLTGIGANGAPGVRAYAEGEYVRVLEGTDSPFADVVEVVRCEECKHRVVDEIVLSLTSVPETAWVCDIGITACLSDFYCGRGERMDGEDL